MWAREAGRSCCVVFGWVCSSRVDTGGNSSYVGVMYGE